MMGYSTLFHPSQELHGKSQETPDGGEGDNTQMGNLQETDLTKVTKVLFNMSHTLLGRCSQLQYWLELISFAHAFNSPS